jgi:NADPH-dependent curcumin reductase CurA
MTTRVNRQWRLATRPTGVIQDANFQWVESPAPSPGDGEILVRNLYLSLDPTQRGWLARDTYMPAIPIGDVVRSGGVGRVEESRDPAFAVGDLVQGLVGWQDYVVLPAKGPGKPQPVPPGMPIPLAMSVLGLTGLTAYFGLLEVGKPKEGETVVVSGAAGATGSVVGQIARIKKCRAIGIAGGKAKCEWLVKECRFDAVVDYKSENVAARLRELCPKGIDVYFDNVGGDILEAALANLAMHARVVICGAIATYNDSEARPGPRNYMNLLIKRARMEGFLTFDYLAKAPEAVMQLFSWVQAGEIVSRVDVEEGLENAPRALRRLFTGDNFGKQLLKVAD